MEWKFARTKLWMTYIDETSTLPVPRSQATLPVPVLYHVTLPSRATLTAPVLYQYHVAELHYQYQYSASTM